MGNTSRIATGATLVQSAGGVAVEPARQRIVDDPKGILKILE